ncbi:hypothetical protein [Micromonospora parathelypteridis]|uniref:Uncharacterized protein n=1 Tax=Micromonospora parathelypteridis TaxID=1839617 RepID=A0A840VGH9_9ACTN|nr:hypothetical protein [Micromonospora parathelypteridis]MBB5475942.1 hypothetical protein [Micromonospora parathelypteridis]GGO32113.1 hypothetical protein GCM10011576_61990 [Micromonospora parathelypteridis]
MIRTLVVATLLLAGCSPTEAPTPAASSTTPSDKSAASACTRVALTIEKNNPPVEDMGTAMRAIESTDSGVREAGQRLGPIAQEAGRLWVENDPTVDKGPANLRLADARQGLLTACTNLFGAYPWPFTRLPSPTPSS